MKLLLFILSTVSLVIIPVSIAERGDFNVVFGFNDLKWHGIRMILDITSSDSFVLDSAIYADKAGRFNTFDPSTSVNFINRTTEFHKSYGQKFNNGSSVVHGYTGKDMIFVKPPNYFLADFGIVTKIEGKGNPVVQSNGVWVGGRLGFARKQVNEHGLVSQILELMGGKDLCMYYDLKDYGYSFAFDYSDPMYTNKTLLKVLNANDNPSGFWELPANFFQFQFYTAKINSSAIFSTTYDGIKLPKIYFNYIVKVTNSKQRADGKFEVDCPSENIQLPSIKIGFNDVVIKIKDTSYAQKDGEKCVLKLEGHEETYIVLGNPFYVDTGVCFNYKAGTVAFFRHL